MGTIRYAWLHHHRCVKVVFVLTLLAIGPRAGLAQQPSAEPHHQRDIPGDSNTKPPVSEGPDSPTSSTMEPLQPDSRLEQTDEVVITATKTSQPVSHVTSAIEVITGEQMQQRNLKTVSDALRLATGMAVFSSGAQGTTTDVRMRGSTPAQVLVLIDGAIVNSATAGGYDFAFLTTDNIERIEILRGNQSMLWGSDAMGGVISITTKRGRGPLSVGGFLEYGSYKSLREGGTVSGQQGPFDWSATLSRWDIAPVSAINYRRGATEMELFHNWQGSGRFGWNLPTRGRFEFDMRWLNSDVTFDGFNGINPADVLGARTRSNQFIYSGNFFQPLTKWWSTRITAARATENLTTQSGTFFRDLFTGQTGLPFQFNSDIRTYSNRIEWQNNFQIIKPLSVTAGYQYREMIGDIVGSFSDRRVASNAGFAEAQLNLWDRLFGTAGIRQDEFNVFGSATTYRLTGGYLHKETGTKIRASYATGFHAPTINQLFFPRFGNPALRPEKSQGGDIGIDQALVQKRVIVSANYFWTRYRDQIVTTFDPVACGGIPGSFGFCPLNFGSTTAKGVEVSVKANLLRDVRWAKSLDVQGQYTHTATRDMTTPPHNRLPRWPLQQYAAIISYQPIDPFRMNVEFRYVGQRFNDTQATQSVPGFDVWNLSATYDVNKHVQAYLRLDNIFDRRYEEVLYFGTPGRSIFGGLRVNWSLL